jgi:transposase-like protein
MATDYQLDPSDVISEFELALLKAVADQFRGVHIQGCLVHFMQAVRRKMTFRLPATEIRTD